MINSKIDGNLNVWYMKPLFSESPNLVNTIRDQNISAKVACEMN